MTMVIMYCAILLFVISSATTLHISMLRNFTRIAVKYLVLLDVKFNFGYWDFFY